MSDPTSLLYCSFCGKESKQVERLIAGPAVYICNEDVELCNDIIEAATLEKAAEKAVAAYIKANPPAQPAAPAKRGLMSRLLFGKLASSPTNTISERVA